MSVKAIIISRLTLITYLGLFLSTRRLDWIILFSLVVCYWSTHEIPPPRTLPAPTPSPKPPPTLEGDVAKPGRGKWITVPSLPCPGWLWHTRERLKFSYCCDIAGVKWRVESDTFCLCLSPKQHHECTSSGKAPIWDSRSLADVGEWFPIDHPWLEER